jgi:DNA-binding response OmpR family regulator
MAASILVIDDTLEILELYEQLLNDEGYKVMLAAQPPGAPDEVARLRPDLIILDFLHGRELQGWGLLQALQQDPATACIPTLVATGANREVQEHAVWLQDHRVPVLHKPFDLEELLTLVKDLLARNDHTHAA